MSLPARPELVAVVCTHTPRHLRAVLAALSLQSLPPDRILVSCDNDAPQIRDLVAAAASDLNLTITLVQRPHAGVARSGQVRNNALRALLLSPHDPHSHLVFFDGDILPHPASLQSHHRLLLSHDFVIAHRIDLTPDQTDSLLARFQSPIDAHSLEHAFASLASPAHLAALHRRQRRYRRQLLLRRLGLAKPHKPKILGANFSIRLHAFLAVNGFDERFEGYGQEDDDLSKRLLLARFQCAPAVHSLLNLHLYHPTRAPRDWNASPTVPLLHAKTSPRCRDGIDNPRPPNPLSFFTLTPTSTPHTPTHTTLPPSSVSL